jgi:signal transduction histidine kinase
VAEGLLWLPSRQVRFTGSPLATPLLGDPHQISQAILLLLKNAMQATDPEERKIEVRTLVTEDSRVVLEVEDNGTGIPGEILPKVLLPFFTTRDGEGVGLGLSIVNGIAEAHGAHLEIQTKVGKGTLIRISFPPAEENLPE